MAAEKTIGPTPVEAIVHPDKRSDIPTADAQDFVGAEMDGRRFGEDGRWHLFTVFGAPDVDVEVDGDQVTVEVVGVDVYDPTTESCEVSRPIKIALWMIDTNYNEESFFVQQCYSTGGNDPYASLKLVEKQ